MSRTLKMTPEQMQAFERCKEERLCNDRNAERFTQLLTDCSGLEVDQLFDKKFFINYFSYILGAQIR
jgi:hypothetical protein